MWGICIQTQLPRNTRDMLTGILFFHFSIILFKWIKHPRIEHCLFLTATSNLYLKHLHNTQRPHSWNRNLHYYLEYWIVYSISEFFWTLAIFFPSPCPKKKTQREAFCLNQREQNCLNQTRKEILKGTFRSISTKLRHFYEAVW